jgi:Ca2+-binding RTX toxin-like protein
MNLSLRSMVVGAVAVGAFVVAPGSASAAVTCTYAAQNHWVIIKLDAAGDSARIAANADTSLSVNHAPCGGATVHNTDTVWVSDLSGGDTQVRLDATRANFEPGFTDEGFGSEIEFNIVFAGGDRDTLYVDGHKAGASIVAGTQGINLNAGAEPLAEDSDVAVSDAEWLSINGSESVDWLSGQGGAGTGQPSKQDLVLSGRGGDDELHGGGSTTWLTYMDGGGGNDVLVAGATGGAMEGGPGDDTLGGGPGKFDGVYYSGAAAGVRVDLAVTAPQDTGAAGVDTITGVEFMDGSMHDDVLKGNGDGNLISGYAGDDVLDGRAGDDQLLGDGGNDTLRPGLGVGWLDGGAGSDTAAYDDEPAAVSVDLSLAGVQQDTGGAGKQRLDSVEGVLGSPFADRLTGSSGPNAIDGGAGADTIAGGNGADRLGGGAGIDTIDSRDASADSVSCGEGPDALAVDSLDIVAPDCAPPPRDPDPSPPAPPASAPVVSAVKVTPKRITRGSALPAVTRSAKRSRIELTVSKAARLEFRFQRRTGRAWKTVRGRIVVPDTKVTPGTVRVRFAGRLSKTRRLKPGAYRVRVTATDTAGIRSKPAGAAFRLRARG